MSAVQPRPRSLSLLTHGGEGQRAITTWSAPAGQDRLQEAFFGYLLTKDRETLDSLGFNTVQSWEELSHHHRWCLFYLQQITRQLTGPATPIPNGASDLRIWYRQKAFLLAFAPLSVTLWLIRQKGGYIKEDYEPRKTWADITDQAMDVAQHLDSDVLYHVSSARYWEHAEGGHVDRQRRTYQYYRGLVQVLLEQAPHTVREADFIWPLYRSGEKHNICISQRVVVN